MNIFKSPGYPPSKPKTTSPTYSPRREVPRQPRATYHSPSPQRYENINRTLGDLCATIDVKYVDQDTNKIQFVKITNEYGQQMIAMVNTPISNVSEEISDVKIKSASQISYPEHLSEYIKTAHSDAFGLANESSDRMIIVMNTEVTEYVFDKVTNRSFNRDHQYIVTRLDTIVENLQPMSRRMYSSIHKINNITQMILFNNLNTYNINIDNMKMMLNDISHFSRSMISNEIDNMTRLNDHAINSPGTISKMELRERFKKSYDIIDDVLESIARLDVHMSQNNMYDDIDKCAHELRLN